MAAPEPRPSTPARATLVGDRNRGARLAAALAVAAVGLTAFGCGGSASTSTESEATEQLANQSPDAGGDVPTDHPHHVYVRGAKALDALAAAKKKTKKEAQAQKPKQKKKPAPKPTAAQLKPGPGGIPPASAGTNGSFKPHSASELKRIAAHSASTVAGTDPDHSAILVGRTALAPPAAPEAVDRAIGAANAIVGRPYVWGGGHGSWNSRGYDCSGSVSYALGGGGLLAAPLDSSHLEHWGEPGPGKWITVYANAGHTYAVIAGLRWDTVGDLRGSGPRWHAELPYPKGFVVRHPAGY